MISFAPYTTVDGIPTMRDSDLASIYQRVVAERSYRWLFFDRFVQDDEGFISLAKSCLFVPALVDNTPAGFFWLDGFHGKTARLHFCVFRAFWGDIARQIGRAAFQFVEGLVKDRNGLQILYGFVPLHNVMAKKYALDVGMAPCGVLPLYFEDAFDGSLVDAAIFAYPLQHQEG